MPSIRLTKDIYLALWERAYQQEFGIELEVDKADIRSIQNELYKSREGIMKYSEIMVCLPEGANKIWLVKKTVDLKEFQEKK